MRERELPKGLVSDARRLLDMLGEAEAELGITFLENEEMEALKERLSRVSHIKGKEPWVRKEEEYTSVLSFPEPKHFPHPESGEKKFLGELYLNKKVPQAELRSLLIHGLLHLLGYRHSTKRDKMKMQKREKELLSFLEEQQ